MSCKHAKHIELTPFTGNPHEEQKILESHGYGETEKITNGTKIKYITFNYVNNTYRVEHGTIVGLYHSVDPSISQYNVLLVCGGRISGAVSTHIKKDEWNIHDISYIE